MAEILIIRLKSIGDVAMTIPVIYSAAKANPADSFTVLTQDFLLPLFLNRPPNVKLIGIDLKTEEKGLRGFLQFARTLARYRYDMVLDLHFVLRTRIIDWIFRLKGRKVFVLDKMRREQKRLTRKPPKDITPLPDMVTRYMDVFFDAGIFFNKTFTSLYDEQPPEKTVLPGIADKKDGRWVGIAPFAGHGEKVYPPEKMEQVVETLSQHEGISLFLFGAKGDEEAVLNAWEKRYAHTQNVAGRYSLEQELALISRLDVLICMDSANMHFASLVGAKAISIWGATHPYAGFYGYGQAPELAVQTKLSCRPCSVFGKKPCYRGDRACLTHIDPETVVRKCLSVL
ncbi:MAG: glycosyltransferase family 9 protein [Tannerella sp.]|jgi:ADP-heptose:LPS heptosyltransferase|nr:glycosyltransferase family 9 protein [Tannerella sp.]